MIFSHCCLFPHFEAVGVPTHGAKVLEWGVESAAVVRQLHKFTCFLLLASRGRERPFSSVSNTDGESRKNRFGWPGIRFFWLDQNLASFARHPVKGFRHFNPDFPTFFGDEMRLLFSGALHLPTHSSVDALTWWVIKLSWHLIMSHFRRFFLSVLSCFLLEGSQTRRECQLLSLYSVKLS